MTETHELNILGSLRSLAPPFFGCLVVIATQLWTHGGNRNKSDQVGVPSSEQPYIRPLLLS